MLTATTAFATNLAFAVGFTVFVVAFVVLVILTLTWAIRHDRAEREDSHRDGPTR
jgi:uncharacterized membrane protein (DUF485 family)